MGVHESNKGLCKALHRMFDTMKCAAAKSVPDDDDERAKLCDDVVRRIVDRNCEKPPKVFEPEWSTMSGRPLDSRN